MRPPTESPVSVSVAKAETAWRDMEKGASAETILKTLDPILEKRLGTLLDGFRMCPSELGALLNYRAAISELWHMRKELKDAAKLGKHAAAVLEAMIQKVGTNP